MKHNKIAEKKLELEIRNDRKVARIITDIREYISYDVCPNCGNELKFKIFTTWSKKCVKCEFGYDEHLGIPKSIRSIPQWFVDKHKGDD